MKFKLVQKKDEEVIRVYVYSTKRKAMDAKIAFEQLDNSLNKKFTYSIEAF